jgi:hypothetical protein
MRCPTVREKLLDYLDDQVASGGRARIEAHLAGCADCRAELAALLRSEDALHALAAVLPAPQLADDLRQRLAAPRPRPLRWAWAGAGAATAAVAIALLVWCIPRPPASRPLPPKPRVAPQITTELRQPPAATEAQLLPAPSTPQPRPAPRRIVRKPAQTTPERAPVPSEEPAILEQERPAAPEPAPTEAPKQPYGIILLLGEAEPMLPSSSSCYFEVSFPSGERSILDQTVDRDAAGEPRAIQISYQRIAPQSGPLNHGG